MSASLDLLSSPLKKSLAGLVLIVKTATMVAEDQDMALGRRKREQQDAWVATTELPKSPGHVFYARLNRLLQEAGFDSLVEDLCRPHYAAVQGRPGIAPGFTSGCCWRATSRA